MRNLRSFATVVTSVALVALSTQFTHAQGFLPSEADIEAMVETDFSGGTQASTLDSIDTTGDGIELNITWDNSGESFTRIVMQRENFDTDLSAFSSFDLNFQTNDSGIGVKTFVQTGAGFSFFESPFTNITPGGAQTVSLPLAGLPDTDNVRQFGFQVFGPASGPGTVRVFGAVVPEPSALALLGAGCCTLLGLRRVR